jgi:uncharacterized membrane protein YvlD (DUF360 family)
LSLIVYTLGLGALLLNVLILWLGSLLVPGVSFSGLGALILTVIGSAQTKQRFNSFSTNLVLRGRFGILVAQDRAI